MRIGLVGAGAIGLGYAAFLSNAGHTVRIWSPTGGRSGPIAAAGRVTVTGAVEAVFRPQMCYSAQALAESDVIVLALPANGHRRVLDELLPHFRPRHIVIISGHLSFAALYLSRRLARIGLDIPIAAWNTSALTAKASSMTEIRVGAIRRSIDVAAIPVHLAERAVAACTAAFGERFVRTDDLLTIALSNLNPQSHLAIALCNLTRMEHGESWLQNSNITPAVARLMEALDEERLAIAAAFGKPVRGILDNYSLAAGVTATSVANAIEVLVARGSNPPGPKTIDSRYVLEDVPFGLVPTLLLADLAGVEAPLHRSGVSILNACYGRDLAAENDLLGELGSLDMTSLQDLAEKGFAPAA